MATAPNTETYSQKNQISDANPDGTVIGQSTTDQIAFYGKVPLAQRVPVAALVAGYTTTGYATSVTANTSVPLASALGSVIGSATALLGNWTTLGSSATTVGTSTYTVSATVNGYTCTNSLITASGSSFNSVQANVLNEVCLTLMGLGLWKNT
jgi:hypothetical protein